MKEYALNSPLPSPPISGGYLVGIDPDVDKSGVALLDTATGKLEVLSLPFPDIIVKIKEWRVRAENEERSIRIVLEAGYLTRGNYHLRPYDTKAVAAAKGMSVGRNHQTGKIIHETLEYYGFSVLPAAPLPKFWSGRNKKITHAELEYFAGPLPRTNQDGRDAALLAWVSAGLPLKIAPRGKGERRAGD